MEDNKADAIETNNAFRKLISRDEVHAIIGLSPPTASSGLQVAQMMKVL